MKSNNRHHKPNESLKLSLSYTIIGLWPVDKQIIRPQAQGIVVMVEILKLTNQGLSMKSNNRHHKPNESLKLRPKGIIK